MIFPLSKAKLLTLIFLILAGCDLPAPDPNSCSGTNCITIAQNDTTPPQLSLAAAIEGGSANNNVTVSPGKTEPTGGQITLTSQTGSLSLVLTAIDPESGIQSAKIFVITTQNISDYLNNIDLQPKYQNTVDQKKPGEMILDRLLIVQALNIASDTPAGCDPIVSGSPGNMFLYAEAINHMGLKSVTDVVNVSWCSPP